MSKTNEVRLIDANALRAKAYAFPCAVGVEHAVTMREIDEAPTIEAIPLERLGEFGKIFMDYKGCPRGAVGRACMPIEEEVLRMKVLIDIDGGKWIPVNAEALHELVEKYITMSSANEISVFTLNALRLGSA